MRTLFNEFLRGVLALGLRITFLEVLAHLLASLLAGSNELTVLPESAATERAIKHLDWLQSHARPNFDENELLDIILFSELLLVLVHDLVGAEPNLIIMEFEGKYVVNERLALRMVLWRVKNLKQKLLHETQVD